MEVRVDGVRRRALIDTGCTHTLVRNGVAKVGAVDARRVRILLADGKYGESSETRDVCLEVVGKRMNVQCIVLAEMLNGVDVIVGMDVLMKVGGMRVTSEGVEFDAEGTVGCSVLDSLSSEHRILDPDYEAWFDGEKWTVKWFWNEREPCVRENIANYGISCDVKEKFDEEIDAWINEGILKRTDDEVEGILPLIAVVQQKKDKVRPVLNFKSVNRSVRSHTGDAQECRSELRKWRKMGDNIAVVDLKRAYLQIHVEESLWKFQTVSHNGVCYRLTRLGFGLKSAPKIMDGIVSYVLKLNSKVNENTSHYVDDIIVNLNGIAECEVVNHLKRYGLVTKEHEDVDDMRVLGLQLRGKNESRRWWVRSPLGDLKNEREGCTRRDVFSICGKLIGHYPICGYLRIECSMIKRGMKGTKWDDFAGDETKRQLKMLLERVEREDPAEGVWSVNVSEKVSVYTDASSIALAVYVEQSGKCLEDAAWLRKSGDVRHINVAELDALIKGIAMVIEWRFSDVIIKCDSTSVVAWVTAFLTKSKKVHVKGMHELLIKRRLEIIAEMINDYGLHVSVEWIPSRRNKADALTRIVRNRAASVCASLGVEEIALEHEKHHFGVNRTLYFVKKKWESAERSDVESVVRNCIRCATVDPHASGVMKGELGVNDTWFRIAVDVVHVEGRKFLSIVDCGPGRYALWVEMKDESGRSVLNAIRKIMYERGFVKEILSDNGGAFKSDMLTAFCSDWNILHKFRCVNEPSGNGIAERNHRTIKRMVARTRKSVEEMLYWYNMSPREGLDEKSVPFASVYAYRLTYADVKCASDNEVVTKLHVGDVVYVKQRSASCTDEWKEGVVTGVNSMWNVSVDGVCTHVKNIRAYDADKKRYV
mgnify:FL=1